MEFNVSMCIFGVYISIYFLTSIKYKKKEKKKEWGRESKASMFYFKITISSKIYADFLLCILFLNKFKINLFFSGLQQLLQLLFLIFQGIGGSHETVHLKNKLYLKKY